MTTKTGGLTLGLAVAAIMALVPAAQAQQATELGTFNAWTARQATDASGVICYVSATPQKSEPAGANRDPIHFMIIHRKGMGTKNEVQTIIGYPYNATNAGMSAAIDGKTYPMVTEGSAALARLDRRRGRVRGGLQGGQQPGHQGHQPARHQYDRYLFAVRCHGGRQRHRHRLQVILPCPVQAKRHNWGGSKRARPIAYQEAMMIKLAAALALAAIVMLPNVAMAQSVRLLGEHRARSSYAASEGAGAVCFAMTKPTSVQPEPDGYSQSYLYITNRPGENVANEFNLGCGLCLPARQHGHGHRQRAEL
ncbi:hypothetical protein N8D56_04635 [Devosia sp. A8/3-2]|nr:hypothetical protein N8D56_04635 [Devosia sp. A8/3-2]